MRTALIVAALIAGAGVAHAQSDPQAETLFREGRAQMEAGNFAAACEAFAGSQRTEASIATLMNLADCREKNGQLATAWGLFLQVATETRDQPGKAAMHTVATDRGRGLEARLSRLTISVPDGSKVEGLRVLRDGIEVDPASWNRAMPIDGGTYEIAASAPGGKPWTARITIAAEHDAQSVDVPRSSRCRPARRAPTRSAATGHAGAAWRW